MEEAESTIANVEDSTANMNTKTSSEHSEWIKIQNRWKKNDTLVGLQKDTTTDWDALKAFIRGTFTAYSCGQQGNKRKNAITRKENNLPRENFSRTITRNRYNLNNLGLKHFFPQNRQKMGQILATSRRVKGSGCKQH